MVGFGKKLSVSKPGDLVKHGKEAIMILKNQGQGSSKSIEKANEDLQKILNMLKTGLSTTSSSGSEKETADSICTQVFSSGLLRMLIENMGNFDLEARKETSLLFNAMLRRNIGGSLPTVDYVSQNCDILMKLCLLYETDSCTNAGLILRECAKYEKLADYLLHNCLWQFFKYVDTSNFDTQSDSFATFKEFLMCHKAKVAEFLEEEYDTFFTKYSELLSSSNYVTRRMSLKILGELLLDRANFNIMSKFISDVSNLKKTMNLLRDSSKNIQFEAFHVFKVFVANPNKPPEIYHILQKNKDKIIAYLNKFQPEKEDDQFTEEKAFLLKQIQQL